MGKFGNELKANAFCWCSITFLCHSITAWIKHYIMCLANGNDTEVKGNPQLPSFKYRICLSRAVPLKPCTMNTVSSYGRKFENVGGFRTSTYRPSGIFLQKEKSHNVISFLCAINVFSEWWAVCSHKSKSITRQINNRNFLICHHSSYLYMRESFSWQYCGVSIIRHPISFSLNLLALVD